MPDSAVRYDVFLSHNSADKPAIEELARQLAAAGLQPFLDKWHLIPGQPWQEVLENALAESASAAIFIGPSGISPWHNEELRAALDKAVRTRDDYRVIPVLLPGADEAVVARFLARRTWVDFRTGLDDAEAFGRLVAGIQGQAIDIGPYRLPDDPAPYRGLLPFEAEHARFFFGRDADTKRLVEKIGRQPFVAVVGASGSGKSSLVRAGLLPALARDALPGSRDWQVLTFTPSSAPLRALANQLATFIPLLDRPEAADKLIGRLTNRPDGLRTTLSALLADRPRLILLFIDQFEELFTLCADGPERCRMEAEQFIANLADAAERGDGQIGIIITLRADFLDRCLAFPGLRKLLEDRQVLLGPLAQADLRDAIGRPAQQVGALLEKGLVNTILADVGDEPGNLPLLQHALHELWLARRGPWLTMDAYEASGGVAGALGRRAQATYDALPPEQQSVARAIFLRLTSLGEGVSDTRRRAERAELYPIGTNPAQVDAVIRTLAGPNTRLIVADEYAVEVAHEALIRGWSALRNWLEEDRESLRTHRRLTDAANEWGRDREESYLYRGVRLAETEEWAAVHGRAMNALEAEFMKASLALRDQEATEKETIRQRELSQLQALAAEQRQRADEGVTSARRLRRRGRIILGATILIVVLLLVALVASLLSNFSLRTALEQRKAAVTAQHEKDAVLIDQHQLVLPLLLDMEHQRHPISDNIPSNAISILANAPVLLDSVNTIVNSVDDPTSFVFQAAFDARGATLAVAGPRKESVTFWDVSNPIDIRKLSSISDSPVGLYGAIEFNNDGTILALSGNNGLELWSLVDTSRPQKIAVLDSESEISQVTFRRDGQVLAAIDGDGSVILWNVSDPKTSSRISKFDIGDRRVTTAFTFNAAGTILATGGYDKVIRLWDVRDTDSPVLLASLAAESAPQSLSFHVSGKALALGGHNSDVTLWDIASLPKSPILIQKLTERTVYSNPVKAQFTQNGQTLVVIGNDGIMLWDTSDVYLPQLRGHSTTEAGHTFLGAVSPNGEHVVTLVSSQFYLFNIAIRSLEDSLCSIVDRNLTNDEWRYYFPDQAYRKTCENLPAHSSAIEALIQQAHDATKAGNQVLAKSLYQQGVRWAEELSNPFTVNRLCRSGALDGFADDVMQACNRAVQLGPALPKVFDSRGIARARTDSIEGAIADFEHFIASSSITQPRRELRQKWIDVLKTGKDPFDQATIELLRQDNVDWDNW